jgi:hypothetical protein
MTNKAITARAAALDRFGADARERLRRLALDLAETILRDDPHIAPLRPDEIDAILRKIEFEASYIHAHHVAACELRLLA